MLKLILMNFFSILEFKRTTILVLILTLLYTIFLFLYPFAWARVFFRTYPPQKINAQIINKNIQNLQNQKPLKAVVIGDSTALGQGTDSVLDSFGYQYLDTFAQKQPLIEFTNFAVSGTRIEQVLDNQISQIPSSVDLIFVSVGSNDVTALISKKDFELKVDQLAQKLSLYKAQVVWLSIPDFVTVPTLWQPLNFFLSQRAKNFNTSTKNILREKIKEKGFIYVDIYNGTRQEFRNNPKKMFAKDNYHPSKEGYKLWAEIINQNFEFKSF